MGTWKEDDAEVVVKLKYDDGSFEYLALSAKFVSWCRMAGLTPKQAIENYIASVTPEDYDGRPEAQGTVRVRNALDVSGTDGMTRRELCEQLKISNITVNAAVQTLQTSGHVEVIGAKRVANVGAPARLYALTEKGRNFKNHIAAAAAKKKEFADGTARMARAILEKKARQDRFAKLRKEAADAWNMYKYYTEQHEKGEVPAAGGDYKQLANDNLDCYRGAVQDAMVMRGMSKANGLYIAAAFQILDARGTDEAAIAEIKDDASWRPESDPLLPAFKKIVELGVEGLMSLWNDLEDLPVTP